MKNNMNLEFIEYNVNEEEFEKIFLDLLDYNKDNKKIRFLNEDGEESIYPTKRIEINDSNNKFLFEINYSIKIPCFIYVFYRVWPLFNEKFKINGVELDRLMKIMFKKHNICKKDITINGIVFW